MDYNNPNKENTRQKGTKAETAAAEYLMSKNFEIIKRNFHFGRYGEIDIIAKDKDTLVFVEVKSRSTLEYGDPLESITPKKQIALRRAAEGYLYVNKIYNTECRFDVVIVDYTKKSDIITHLVNAI